MSLLPSIDELRRKHEEIVRKEVADLAEARAKRDRERAEALKWQHFVEEALADPAKRKRLEENALQALKDLSSVAKRVRRGTPEFDRCWYLIRLDWAVDLARLGLPYDMNHWRPIRP